MAWWCMVTWVVGEYAGLLGRWCLEGRNKIAQKVKIKKIKATVTCGDMRDVLWCFRFPDEWAAGIRDVNGFGIKYFKLTITPKAAKRAPIIWHNANIVEITSGHLCHAHHCWFTSNLFSRKTFHRHRCFIMFYPTKRTSFFKASDVHVGYGCKTQVIRLCKAQGLENEESWPDKLHSAWIFQTRLGPRF